MNRFDTAAEIYKNYGIDAQKAIDTLKNVTVSMHCWQGDDVVGFDTKESLSGGIQTTGNYPGKARTFDELTADIDKAMSLIRAKRSLIFTLAMRFLRTANLPTEMNLNPNILKNG